MKNFEKREVDIVVISDLHLGTYGCKANELLNYLKTIKPKILILNGDIIDIWQFNKRYFPKSHMKVIKYITSILSKEVKVFYVIGNHDEMLRKFEGFKIGSLKIVNKLVLELADGSKAWFFHGDVFDVTMKHSKWLAKLGGKGYDLLIVINTFVNWISKLFGQGKISLSKKIKNSVNGALKLINNFEDTAAEIAINNNYEYVVCGHIHQPQMKYIQKSNGSTTYLNSGDWVENLTALEYSKEKWTIYEYAKDLKAQSLAESNKGVEDIELSMTEFKSQELFESLVSEFKLGMFAEAG
jgi:UDP-2,3-diacylglucosamine pyrophosphatase LpxH